MEIDLLANYPKTRRDPAARGAEKTEEDRRVARSFGKEFFDGERRTGYGGYSYHPRYWQPVVPDFVSRYGLNAASRILDIGCAKGFMLHDFRILVPGIRVAGVDVSEYAISNAVEDVKPFLRVGDARSLPFEDGSFDLAISITTLHNLEREEIRQALGEIRRVARRSFITVDAYRDGAEKERMLAWNLTARTIMHVEEWKRFLEECGYEGDYYWFTP
jgi:SAM-dependent methyltransferase